MANEEPEKTLAEKYPKEEETSYPFGPYKVYASEVFYESKWSLAFVNLKPIVPGHVLIIPRRVVERFKDLSPEEVSDFWVTAQLVGQKLEPHFGATSTTFAIQDGPQAGQTVAHVHIHVLPRRVGDFKKNDDVYDAIDVNDKEIAKEKEMDLDEQRKPRTKEQMAAEATELRGLFA